MNKKILFIFLLAFISFVNNLICNFDYLIELFTTLPISFYFTKSLTKTEIVSYLNILYTIFCFFTFFITKNPLSVFKI